MKQSTLVRGNESISLQGQRLVVAGGTQGIGEAVACRFAKAGAEVWFIGRNQTRANAVLAKLKEISKKQRIDPMPEHYFLKADLSLVSETKRVAEAIRVRAGSQGVEYLVMTQGGPPNGTFEPTSEAHEQHYAVQVLSRFVLAYELAGDPSSSTIKKAVMSIMAPGKTWTAVDYDDLEMFKAKERGKYGMLAALSRDSNVVDAFTKELGIRNPKVNFAHVFPGWVKTDSIHNGNWPWYIVLVISAAVNVMGTSSDAYAEVPFYLLGHPDGRVFAAKEPYSDQNLTRLEPNPSVRDEDLRGKVWSHLISVLDVKT